MDNKTKIGVIGAGTMGSGIAQVAAMYGHNVILYDVSEEILQQSSERLRKILKRQIEKGKMSNDYVKNILDKIIYSNSIERCKDCRLIIEAVIEDLEVKHNVFSQLESLVNRDTILATNTSSLSITSVASACEKSERVIGTHFFNPAPLMPLVEIVPGLNTSDKVLAKTKNLIDAWGKITVIAKDTPGFIVNRVARPFYGEALRIYEESIADVATIDWAVKEIGGFRMGPFELMDLIGNDVNYHVTQSIFEAFFYDPRFKPSFTQKRMVEAKLFGRKSGRGYYDYEPESINPQPQRDTKIGENIFMRILVMLINEAIDAVFLNIATVKDIDLAMTKGVNYPQGLLKWADELGLENVLSRLNDLFEEYGEDRYRPNPLLKRMVQEKKKFY